MLCHFRWAPCWLVIIIGTGLFTILRRWEHYRFYITRISGNIRRRSNIAEDIRITSEHFWGKCSDELRLLSTEEILGPQTDVKLLHLKLKRQRELLENSESFVNSLFWHQNHWYHSSYLILPPFCATPKRRSHREVVMKPLRLLVALPLGASSPVSALGENIGFNWSSQWFPWASNST